MSACRN